MKKMENECAEIIFISTIPPRQRRAASAAPFLRRENRAECIIIPSRRGAVA